MHQSSLKAPLTIQIVAVESLPLNTVLVAIGTKTTKFVFNKLAILAVTASMVFCYNNLPSVLNICLTSRAIRPSDEKEETSGQVSFQHQTSLVRNFFSPQVCKSTNTTKPQLISCLLQKRKKKKWVRLKGFPRCRHPSPPPAPIPYHLPP